ncbi:MAG: ABC transporter permease [Candidatus Pelagibacter sp. TMED64]|nr:MAG: ABC transporter permease [Candidatus Pelagibacter sp. TMED64]
MVVSFIPRFFNKTQSIKKQRLMLYELIKVNSLSFYRKIISLILFFGFWQFLCTIDFNFGINFIFVPTPIEVINAFFNFVNDSPWVHIKASILRVIGGFITGSIFGIILGLFIGSSKLVEDLVSTPLELLRPIPAVAWIPLAILMFPDAESGMYYITFVGAFYPILISTQKAVESTLSDRLMIRVGQSLGANWLNLFADIIIPSSLPGISAGLVIGMGNAWFCLVTAEIIAGRFGIGYKTWESYVISEYPPIVMGMILIGLLGSLSSYLVFRFTNSLMPWRTITKNGL